MRKRWPGWRLIAVAGVLLAGIATARADNNELAKLGEEHMAAGRYPAAIKAFEKITPTYEHIIAINFDLAWCYYLTSAYEKAIPLFESLSSVRAPSEEVKQQSLFLLAECTARLAESQEDKNAARKKNIQQAIELQTKFMATYPKSGFFPNSLYGRAYAYFLDNQFDKAETDLTALIRTYPANSAARDAQYLIANVYSRQALALLKAGKKTEAQPALEKARNIFGQLAKIQGNLAMANDSAFALAETWFNAGYYQNAIRYYREVRAKQDVLQDLRARVALLDTQRAGEIGRGASTAMTKSEIDKLKAQYTSISEGPDLMMTSYLRIALCFFQQRQFEETRIVCQHLLDMKVLPDDQKPEVSFLIVNAYIEDKNADGAAKALANFRESFGPGLPIAEMAGLAIGQLMLQANKPQEALRLCADSIEDYPQGKGAEDALFMKFAAEFMLDQFVNVNETAEVYMEKFPRGKYTPNALYLQAMSQAALKEWDDAAQTIGHLIQRFPGKTDHFSAVDEAAYQRGWIIYQKAQAMNPEAAAEKDRAKIKDLKQKNLAEALKHFEFFLDNYKDSKLRPIGMYQTAVVLNAAGQLDKAKATLQGLAREYPDHEIAPTALYQIGVMYYEKEDFPQMGEAMEALVKAYSNAPITPEAYYWIGFIAKKEAKFDKAVEALGQSISLAPQSRLAPECQFLTAQAYREKAEALGTPVMLSEERKIVYRDTVLESARAYEALLAAYPDTVPAQESIPSIANNLFDLVRSRLLKEEEAVAWFALAKTRHASEPDIKARIAFSQGSFLLKTKNKEQALLAFKEAFALNPNVRLSAVMLSDYAEALKDANMMAEAEKIYNKIIADYAEDERALAPAWFGIADIKYRQNDFEAAKAAFEKVLKDFPWYEPGKQGRVKLATILENNKKYDEAEKMFMAVWKQEKGVARVSAMLGVARCQLARANAYKQEGRIADMKIMVKAADDNATKVIVLYGDADVYREYAAEALWIKGQIYDIAEDAVNARKTYDKLVKEYKNYPPAKPAAERLQKLGGPLPEPAGTTGQK